MQRFLHILSPISLLAVIYLINNGISAGKLLEYIGIHLTYDLPQYVSYATYVIAVIGYAWFLTFMFKLMRRGEIRSENIVQLDADNSGVLAMLLAYVFVGLSIHNFWTLMVVMVCLLIFNLAGSSHIYNPIFYVFGYRYYYVVSSKTKILVMTKTRYPLGANADFPFCGCLNDYTYIDISKKI